MTYALPGNTIFFPIAPAQQWKELRWAIKDPADTVLRMYDFTDYLAHTSDTIDSVDIVSITPSDLTFNSQLISGATISWLAEGGTFTNPITDYCIEVRVTSAQGQVLNRRLWMEVTQLSPETLTGNSVTVVVGPQGAPGRGITSITQPTGSAELVVTYTDSTTTTFELPVASNQQILAAFAATPSLIVEILDAAVAANAFPTSNTGSGGGFWLYGTLLSIGG